MSKQFLGQILGYNHLLAKAKIHNFHLDCIGDYIRPCLCWYKLLIFFCVGHLELGQVLERVQVLEQVEVLERGQVLGQERGQEQVRVQVVADQFHRLIHPEPHKSPNVL